MRDGFRRLAVAVKLSTSGSLAGNIRKGKRVMIKASSCLLVPLAVLLTVTVLLAGCGGSKTPSSAPQQQPAQQQPAQQPSQPAPAQKPVRAALFHLVRANAYDQARIDGINGKAKELNAQVDFFSCEYNTQEQINQIQDAITANKYDVFMIHPNDSNALVPAIQEALKKGIVVIGADAPIGPNTRSLKPYPEGVKCIIGRTGWTTGTFLGKAVVEASKGKKVSKVAYLIGMQALSIDQDRYEALKQVIKDQPHIQVVAFQEGQYRRDISRQVMQNVLQAHPDISVVVSSGDQMTLGAYDAAKEAGLEKKIKFIGNGCSKEGLQAIKDGWFFGGYADIPYTQGQLLIETAVKAVRGEKVPEYINLEDQRPPLPPEGPIITQENVGKFQGQW
ncbi:MAG: sugar ABC transporter substrate-binding protein [Firmicutes bacterium]|nr:sugar ABC transporter substrate-binding protein [Bacillota bacterium]